MLAEESMSTNTPSRPEEDGIDITEFINEWGKPVLLPIGGGAITLWIGNVNDITWLSVVGFFVIAWGLYGVYERVGVLRMGLPLIGIGLLVGFIFYSMEFWLGLIVAAGVTVLGGYNLYGRIVGAAGDLIESGVEAAESRIVAAAKKKKQASSAKGASHDNTEK